MRAALLVMIVGALLGPEPSWNVQGGTLHPPDVPTLIFSWSWSTADPPYYSITITPMGSVTYKSFPNSDQKTGSPYVIEFEASRGMRTRIFALVQQLNFFRAKYRITHNPDPRVVSKSLTYAAGPQQTGIIYTTTKSRQISELTALFEGMDTTVNYRSSLEVTHSRNPEALEKDLKEIELRSKKKKLVEPQILTPALRQLALDSNVPPLARQNAQSILREIGTP